MNTQQIRATITFLRARQAARAQGYPVSLTTDPTWLVHMAINRRAGWAEDRHGRGAVIPCRPAGHGNGQGILAMYLPRAATGDAQRHLTRIARQVNTPRVIVRPAELGEWRAYLVARIPGRFAAD